VNSSHTARVTETKNEECWGREEFIRTTTTSSNLVRAESVSGVGWGFLAICVVCMIMIANNAVRQSDQQSARLVDHLDPGRLFDFYRA